MLNITPAGLTSPSRILASLNGQHHVTDGLKHQVKSYGFFVHPGGARLLDIELDPDLNTGDTTWLIATDFTGETEYIIPGIISVTLESGGLSLFKAEK